MVPREGKQGASHGNEQQAPEHIRRNRHHGLSEERRQHARSYRKENRGFARETEERRRSHWGGEDIGAPGYGREIRSITYRPRRMLSRRPERLKDGRARLLSGSHKNRAAKNISGRARPLIVGAHSLWSIAFPERGWKRR